MTNKQPTQKDRVYDYIKSIGGAIPREDLQRWGLQNHISDADKRARELIAEIPPKLSRRVINDMEKDYWGYEMDVVVYTTVNPGN